MHLDKSQIRQHCRKIRVELSESERHARAVQLAHSINQLPQFITARSVAGYLAQDGELSLDAVFNLCWQQQKTVYLPKLRPLPPNRLWFAPYSKNIPLLPNRFTIPEPDISPTGCIRPSQIEVVLFPLVAFDDQGNRLGMGGGFYDRTFAHLKTTVKRPLFIGIAYEEQRVNRLPVEPWDIPLDAVATPNRLWRWSI